MEENFNQELELITPQNANKKSITWLIVFALSAILCTVAIIVLITHLVPVKEDFGDFKNPISSTVTTEAPVNPINFDALQVENPEVCAWIQVDGTIIDYPVLRSGITTDEDFYLDHDMNGAQKRTGAIYIQQLNDKDFSDPNTVIYGHNMLNGTMFGTLKRFRGADFFEQNRYIYVYTPGHILKYEIASAFVYDDRHLLNSFQFENTVDYQAFIDQCLNPTSVAKRVREGVSIETTDKIITLSTCTSVDTERYLVVGKLIEDTVTK